MVPYQSLTLQSFPSGCWSSGMPMLSCAFEILSPFLTHRCFDDIFIASKPSTYHIWPIWLTPRGCEGPEISGDRRAITGKPFHVWEPKEKAAGEMEFICAMGEKVPPSVWNQMGLTADFSDYFLCGLGRSLSFLKPVFSSVKYKFYLP